jgi:nicotinamidase-related amidase
LGRVQPPTGKKAIDGEDDADGIDFCGYAQRFRRRVLANPVANGIVDPIAHLSEDARQRDGWLVIYANDAHQPDDFEFSYSALSNAKLVVRRVRRNHARQSG